jgi:hypothetical protein
VVQIKSESLDCKLHAFTMIHHEATEMRIKHLLKIGVQSSPVVFSGQTQ